MSAPSVRLAGGLLAARAAGALLRRAGRGGTSLPGKVLTRVEPRAIARLGARLERGSVVVSATNGKTTTAAMIAAIVERAGVSLVHNRAGANMAGGVAAALAGAARGGGRGMSGQLGLFEVDEMWLGPVVEQLEPRALLLGNLFRDQLDRYGELEAIADRWAGVAAQVRTRTRLVLNADDPVVADLGRVRGGDDRAVVAGDGGGAMAEHDRAAAAGDGGGARADHGRAAAAIGDARAVYFGVEDDSLALPELQHAADSKHCRRCGHAYVYEVAYYAHLGRYRCPNCGARRPDPDVVATAVELRGIRAAAFTLHAGGEQRRIELPLPGLYNVYNALGAAALALALGIGLDDVAAGLAAVEPAFGRAETLDLDGRPTSILLVKNPAGANEVLRTLALERAELDLFGVLNDRIADGRDISWVWDADWELIVPHVRRMTCSGTRAAELALRLKYAGVDADRLHVVEDLGDGLDAALAAGEGPLYALPTYTALLELRELLARRGQAREYWR